MGDYLYLVQMDVPNDKEDAFNRIYDTQHVPNLLNLPGLSACTRYKLESTDQEGMAQYLALYEMDSPDLPETAEWKEQSDKGDWAMEVRPYTTNRSHAVFKKVD